MRPVDTGVGTTVARLYSGLKTRIETARYDECLAFYTDVIGLQRLESWDEEGDRGTILGLDEATGGEAFLELVPTTREGASAGVGLQLRLDDIAAAVDRLRGRWEFSGPEPRPWGSLYVRLVDPDGVAVVLYQGGL